MVLIGAAIAGVVGYFGAPVALSAVGFTAGGVAAGSAAAAAQGKQASKLFIN